MLTKIKMGRVLGTIAFSLLFSCQGNGVIDSSIRPLELVVTSQNSTPLEAIIVGQSAQLSLRAVTRTGDRRVLNARFRLENNTFGNIDEKGNLVPLQAGETKVVAEIGSITETFQIQIQQLNTLGENNAPQNPVESVLNNTSGGGASTNPSGAQGETGTAQLTPVQGSQETTNPVVPVEETNSQGTSLDNLSISVSPSQVLLSKSGEQFQLIAFVKNGKGEFIDLSQVSLVWSSSNPTAIGVDQGGMITANAGSGAVNITVSLASDPSISAFSGVSIGSSGSNPPPPAIGGSDEVEGTIKF